MILFEDTLLVTRKHSAIRTDALPRFEVTDVIKVIVFSLRQSPVINIFEIEILVSADVRVFAQRVL